MPPVLSTQRNANAPTKYCRKCKEDVPAVVRFWDFQLKMCCGCALTYIPPIRIPGGRVPRQACTLCSNMFSIHSFASPPGEAPHTRCVHCRRKERCTRCRKIKKKKEFRRPTDEDRTRPLLKTCNKCRLKQTREYISRRQQAETTGMINHVCRMDANSPFIQGTGGVLAAGK